MPLVRCPACSSTTPSVGITCVHCGSLPPTCPECSGTGKCPVCGTAAAPEFVVAVSTCGRCDGDGTCKGCEGRKRRWPVANSA